MTCCPIRMQLKASMRDTNRRRFLAGNKTRVNIFSTSLPLDSVCTWHLMSLTQEFIVRTIQLNLTGFRQNRLRKALSHYEACKSLDLHLIGRLNERIMEIRDDATRSTFSKKKLVLWFWSVNVKPNNWYESAVFLRLWRRLKINCERKYAKIEHVKKGASQTHTKNLPWNRTCYFTRV